MEGVTRRQVLKKGLAITAGILGLSSGVTKQQEAPTLPTETPKESTINTEDVLFKNYSSEERARMEKKIEEQLNTYKSNDPSRAQRTLKNWKSTIDKILQLDMPSQKHPLWFELLAGLLYLEGGGNLIKNINKPTQTSIAGAEGPAQIKKGIAEAVANKHGIYNVDPTNGWTSIRIARFHLEDLLEKYGSLDLAYLAYYAGEPFVDKKIQLKSAIEYSRINVENLGSEDGEEYFKKIVAGIKHLRETTI